MSEAVVHLSGTSWKKPNGYDSWLAYLYVLSGSTSIRCATTGCDGVAQVGAHVKFVDVGDARHWIVPACYRCNAQRGRVLEIRETAPCVPANQRVAEREGWDDESESSPVATAVGVGAVVAGAGLLGWALYEALRSRPSAAPQQVPSPPLPQVW